MLTCSRYLFTVHVNLCVPEKKINLKVILKFLINRFFLKQTFNIHFKQKKGGRKAKAVEEKRQSTQSSTAKAVESQYRAKAVEGRLEYTKAKRK